jgi:hypothetical protein
MTTARPTTGRRASFAAIPVTLCREAADRLDKISRNRKVANLLSALCATITMSIACCTVRTLRIFIGTEPDRTHKAKRFRTRDNPDIAHDEAFLLSSPDTRKLYERAYVESSALHYGDIRNARSDP